MQVATENITLTKDQFEIIFKITGDLSRLAHDSYGESLFSMARRQANLEVDKIVEEFVGKHESEIIKQIDLDTLVKKVQIKLIQKMGV